MTIDIDNGIPAKIKKLSQVYDSDYFENGPQTKKSNYRDYSWDRLGSYFQRTARHIVDLFKPERTLDVGCAKGFLVKALDESGVDFTAELAKYYSNDKEHWDEIISVVGDRLLGVEELIKIPVRGETRIVYKIMLSEPDRC